MFFLLGGLIMSISVSRKMSILGQYAGEIREEVGAWLGILQRVICDEMDNHKRKFRLPSPHDDELRPIVVDQLDALILRLIRKSESLKGLLR